VLILSQKINLSKYEKYILICLVILSLIPKIYFLNNKPYYIQSGLYDVPAHISYIKFVAHNYKLPKPIDCWECYQQPLYYILAASVYNSAQLLGVNQEQDLIRILQYFSLLIFYLFLVVSILIFRLMLDLKKAILASSLLLYWPSTTFHAVRIGNDVLLYLFVAVALYSLLHWYKKEKRQSLVTSVIFILAGLVTKTNALVMLPVILLSFYLKKKSIKKSAIFTFVLLILITIFGVFNLRHTLLGNEQDNWLVGNFGDIKNFVGNSFINYTYFDFISYIYYPNISPVSDIGGRQYFWVYLLKTSLFGELLIENPGFGYLAKIISLMLLLMVIFLVIRVLTFKKSQLKELGPILLTLLFFVASSMIFRFFYPCPCSNEFRYIYPVLIPFLILVLLFQQWLKRGWEGLFMWFLILFICFSLLFSFGYSM
jgi:hypothetical protein